MPVDNGTIFDGTDKSQTPGSTEAQTSQASTTSTDQSDVAILVGEGRKYRTMDDLARAYLKADEFIETLKAENATLREETAKAKTLDEVLQRLDTNKAGATDNATQGSLTAADVSKIVKETLTGLETQRTREANLARANSKMQEVFGERAKEVFDSGASTPELRAALINLAQVDPDKFVALFAPTQSAGSTSQVDSGSAKSTAAMSAAPATGRASDPGCKEFYDEMRRKNPQQYYSQAVQLQIHDAALANPDKYFGRKRS